MKIDEGKIVFRKTSTFSKGAQFLARLIKPLSNTENEQRIEFIFNVIVATSIVVCSIFSLTVLYEVLTTDYQGVPLHIIGEIIVFFLFLYYLSRLGYFLLSSYLLISVYLLATIYTLIHWGADVPIGTLSLALIIVMTGILLGTKGAFFMTFFSILFLNILTYLESSSRFIVNNYWKKNPVMFDDALETSVLLLLIITLSWLYNREIKKSLHRALHSEAELKKEKDNLEIKIKERTEALQKIQFEKLRQLYRFAEFGRLSSGLFHDLNNYLTALSMNLQRAKGCKQEDTFDHIQKYVTHALTTSTKMDDFIQAIQKQLKKHEDCVQFSVAKEINQILQLFHYRTKKEQVELFSRCQDKFVLYGNPIRFSQAVTNIISNAFDSYREVSPQYLSRKVEIGAWRDTAELIILIRDWGGGISPENLPKIFDPFFTTKGPEQGIGIGLASTKEVFEKDFHGRIEVESQLNYGTSFKIILPYVQNQ